MKNPIPLPKKHLTVEAERAVKFGTLKVFQ